MTKTTIMECLRSNMVNTIIFDAYGTIIDTKEGSIQAKKKLYWEKIAAKLMQRNFILNGRIIKEYILKH